MAKYGIMIHTRGREKKKKRKKGSVGLKDSNPRLRTLGHASNRKRPKYFFIYPLSLV